MPRIDYVPYDVFPRPAVEDLEDVEPVSALEILWKSSVDSALFGLPGLFGLIDVPSGQDFWQKTARIVGEGVGLLAGLMFTGGAGLLARGGLRLGARGLAAIGAETAAKTAARLSAVPILRQMSGSLGRLAAGAIGEVVPRLGLSPLWSQGVARAAGAFVEGGTYLGSLMAAQAVTSEFIVKSIASSDEEKRARRQLRQLLERGAISQEDYERALAFLEGSPSGVLSEAGRLALEGGVLGGVSGLLGIAVKPLEGVLRRVEGAQVEWSKRVLERAASFLEDYSQDKALAVWDELYRATRDYMRGADLWTAFYRSGLEWKDRAAIAGYVLGSSLVHALPFAAYSYLRAHEALGESSDALVTAGEELALLGLVVPVLSGGFRALGAGALALREDLGRKWIESTLFRQHERGRLGDVESITQYIESKAWPYRGLLRLGVLPAAGRDWADAAIGLIRAGALEPEVAKEATRLTFQGAALASLRARAERLGSEAEIRDMLRSQGESVLELALGTKDPDEAYSRLVSTLGVPDPSVAQIPHLGLVHVEQDPEVRRSLQVAGSLFGRGLMAEVMGIIETVWTMGRAGIAGIALQGEAAARIVEGLSEGTRFESLPLEVKARYLAEQRLAQYALYDMFQAILGTESRRMRVEDVLEQATGHLAGTVVGEAPQDIVLARTDQKDAAIIELANRFIDGILGKGANREVGTARLILTLGRFKRFVDFLGPDERARLTPEQRVDLLREAAEQAVAEENERSPDWQAALDVATRILAKLDENAGTLTLGLALADVLRLAKDVYRTHVFSDEFVEGLRGKDVYVLHGLSIVQGQVTDVARVSIGGRKQYLVKVRLDTNEGGGRGALEVWRPLYRYEMAEGPGPMSVFLSRAEIEDYIHRAVSSARVTPEGLEEDKVAAFARTVEYGRLRKALKVDAPPGAFYEALRLLDEPLPDRRMKALQGILTKYKIADEKVSSTLARLVGGDLRGVRAGVPVEGILSDPKAVRRTLEKVWGEGVLPPAEYFKDLPIASTPEGETFALTLWLALRAWLPSKEAFLAGASWGKQLEAASYFYDRIHDLRSKALDEGTLGLLIHEVSRRIQTSRSRQAFIRKFSEAVLRDILGEVRMDQATEQAAEAVRKIEAYAHGQGPWGERLRAFYARAWSTAWEEAKSKLTESVLANYTRYVLAPRVKSLATWLLVADDTLTPEQRLYVRRLFDAADAIAARGFSPEAAEFMNRQAETLVSTLPPRTADYVLTAFGPLPGDAVLSIRSAPPDTPAPLIEVPDEIFEAKLPKTLENVDFQGIRGAWREVLQAKARAVDALGYHLYRAGVYHIPTKRIDWDRIEGLEDVFRPMLRDLHTELRQSFNAELSLTDHISRIVSNEETRLWNNPIYRAIHTLQTQLAIYNMRSVEGLGFAMAPVLDVPLEDGLAAWLPGNMAFIRRAREVKPQAFRDVLGEADGLVDWSKDRLDDALRPLVEDGGYGAVQVDTIRRRVLRLATDYWLELSGKFTPYRSLRAMPDLEYKITGAWGSVVRRRVGFQDLVGFTEQSVVHSAMAETIRDWLRPEARRSVLLRLMALWRRWVTAYNGRTYTNNMYGNIWWFYPLATGRGGSLNPQLLDAGAEGFIDNLERTLTLIRSEGESALLDLFAQGPVKRGLERFGSQPVHLLSRAVQAIRRDLSGERETGDLLFRWGRVFSQMQMHIYGTVTALLDTTLTKDVLASHLTPFDFLLSLVEKTPPTKLERIRRRVNIVASSAEAAQFNYAMSDLALRLAVLGEAIRRVEARTGKAFDKFRDAWNDADVQQEYREMAEFIPDYSRYDYRTLDELTTFVPFVSFKLEAARILSKAMIERPTAVLRVASYQTGLLLSTLGLRSLLLWLSPALESQDPSVGPALELSVLSMGGYLDWLSGFGRVYLPVYLKDGFKPSLTPPESRFDDTRVVMVDLNPIYVGQDFVPGTARILREGAAGVLDHFQQWFGNVPIIRLQGAWQRTRDEEGLMEKVVRFAFEASTATGPWAWHRYMLKDIWNALGRADTGMLDRWLRERHPLMRSSKILGSAVTAMLPIPRVEVVRTDVPSIVEQLDRELGVLRGLRGERLSVYRRAIEEALTQESPSIESALSAYEKLTQEQREWDAKIARLTFIKYLYLTGNEDVLAK